MIKHFAGSVCVLMLAACGGTAEQSLTEPESNISASPTPSGPLVLATEQAGSAT